jgi:hypothetical protein
MVKSNPEMSVEIPEQIFLVQNHDGFNGAKTGFLYLLPFRRYSGNKTGKIGKPQTRPSTLVHFIVFLGQ